MYKPHDILDAREKRIEFQKSLQERYEMPLMVIRVNYPGLNKDNDITREIINIIDNIINEMFDDEIYYRMLTYTAEGPILLIIIDKYAEDIKKIAIDIENKHTLGRCVDIDVYDVDGTSMSRTEFGYEMRKCFLCEDLAHCCVRSKRHVEKEIIQYIKSKYAEYMESFYGQNKTGY